MQGVTFNARAKTVKRKRHRLMDGLMDRLRRTMDGLMDRLRIESFRHTGYNGYNWTLS